MNTALIDCLPALDRSGPMIMGALAGLTLVLATHGVVGALRRRRDTVLRDLELGIRAERRCLPLWAHAVVGAMAGGILGAVVLCPWLLLAATQQGLPAAAIVPGLVEIGRAHV